MAYTVPSVLVYQQLANAGGVANITPDLPGCIIGPCFNVLDYVSSSAAALANTAAGTITNNRVSTEVQLPSQKPGQVVELSSLQVYVNGAIVETLSTKFQGTAGDSLVTMLAAAGVTTGVAQSAVLRDTTNLEKFAEGDVVVIEGAGLGGSNLVATISEISGADVILDKDVVVSVTNANITKQEVSNINPITATRRIEPGDLVVVAYTNALGESKSFQSTVTEVEALNGDVSSLDLADILPDDIAGPLLISTRKQYNNQPFPKEIEGYPNYDDSVVGAQNKIKVNPKARLPYGVIVTGTVHIAYRALRKDLGGQIVTISSPREIEGILGTPSDRNPLALGVQIAMANTIGEILAIAVPNENLLGYQEALDLAEGQRIYAIAPLTDDIDICTAVQQHCEQMSTPEMASWRTALVSTGVPDSVYIGQYNPELVNDNGGNNTVGRDEASGEYRLRASNAQFVTDGVVPGDSLHVVSPSNIAGVYQIQGVLNNQTLSIRGNIVGAAVSYYISRNLSKANQAEVVAGNSKTFGSKRIVHCPNTAGITIDGVTKYLPSFYINCALVGLISGLPAQQGLTNIALAGISDVKHSNFYFTRAQMDSMAAAGTLLLVQQNQGSVPYIRHELTTDMSVLQYREIQQVKNIDYLSYFFHDILQGFIGKWNITPDSLQTLRQVITAGGNLLKGKSLPRIGAPLIDFNIAELKQDPDNRDHVICRLECRIPTVMNYINIYLVV